MRDPGEMVMPLALADERTDLAAAVPGVRFRRFRGPEDFEAMSTLTFACQDIDGRDGRSAQTLSALLETVMAGSELADGILLAEVDGVVIGFGDGYCSGDNEGIGRMLEHACRVLPEWRSKGIGRVLLKEAQAAARRRASTRPPTDLPVVFVSYVNETEAASVRLLTRDGYRPARYEFSMVRPTLDDPPDDALPPGIELRPVRREVSLAILQAADEAFRDEPTYAAQTDAQLEAWGASPIGGQLDVWQVAWDGEEVVAGVLGHIDEDENRLSGRRRGYTQLIFTRRPWRGRGLASALIGRNLRELARRGMAEAALFVDADNPSAALRIYERAGFVRDKVLILFARPVEPACDPPSGTRD
jgi:mycothiol synthase